MSSAVLLVPLFQKLGFEAEKAKCIVERFRTHDEVMIREQFKVRQGNKTLICVSQQGVPQLAQVLSDDSHQTYIETDSVK